MNRELDDLLNDSAPPRAVRSAELAGAVGDLITQTEETTFPRQRRWRRRLVGGALGVVVAAVGVTSATSDGYYDRPAPQAGWETHPSAVHIELIMPGGKPCVVTYMVNPTWESRELRKPVQDEVWATALNVLESVDVNTLTTQAIRDRYRREYNLANPRDIDPDERAPRITDAEVIRNAPGAELMERVQGELTRQDLPAGAVLMGQSWSCGDAEAQ